MEVQSLSMVSRVITFAGDGALVADQNGRILLVNRAAEELFGFAAEQMLGRRIEALIAKRSRQFYRQWADGLLTAPDRTTGLSRRRCEMTGRRCGGSEFKIDATLSCCIADRPIVIAVLRESQRAVERSPKQTRNSRSLSLPERHVGALTWPGVELARSAKRPRVISTRPSWCLAPYRPCCHSRSKGARLRHAGHPGGRERCPRDPRDCARLR
jgi:PAS domain S-box-containing protein